MLITTELTQTAKYVLKTVRQAGQKIALAESCTGGLVSALLTDIPGSSDVFDRGFVTYSNEAKMELLDVSQSTLDQHGAVSAETAMEMAQGALENSAATITAAITGIAGPGGGSEEKPVGLVFIAVAGPMGLVVEELHLEFLNRESVRAQAAQAALEMLIAFGLDFDEDEFSGPSNLN